MKLFERIFLYLVIAILAFHVFLVDDKVESQGAIQNEIRARRISIVNNEGLDVVRLTSSVQNNGGIYIRDKDGNNVAFLIASGEGGFMSILNKYGQSCVLLRGSENGGDIEVIKR